MPRLEEKLKFKSDLTIIDLEYKFYNKLFLDEFLKKYKIFDQLKDKFSHVKSSGIKLGEYGFGWSIDKFKTINYEVTDELLVIKDTFKDWKNDVAIPVIKKSEEFLEDCYRFNDITFLMTTIKDSSGNLVNENRKRRYLKSMIPYDNYFVERSVQNNVIKILMFVLNKRSRFSLQRCIEDPQVDEVVDLKCDPGSKFILMNGESNVVFVNDRNYNKDAGNMFIPIAYVKDNGVKKTVYYCENVLYTIKKSSSLVNFSITERVMTRFY